MSGNSVSLYVGRGSPLATTGRLFTHAPLTRIPDCWQLDAPCHHEFSVPAWEPNGIAASKNPEALCRDGDGAYRVRPHSSWMTRPALHLPQVQGGNGIRAPISVAQRLVGVECHQVSHVLGLKH